MRVNLTKVKFLRTVSKVLISAFFLFLAAAPCTISAGEWSVARHWNEEMLEAVRRDYARPTIHARNLFHVSAAMWDAWAAYGDVETSVQHYERLQSGDVLAAREAAISYAAYRLLTWRFTNSPGAAESLPAFDARMDELGYDRNFTSTIGDSPAALGNRIAETYINFGLSDNSNEPGEYENLFYQTINGPLVPALPGNPDLENPNRWQPLALEFFVDQGGNIILGGYPDFLSPEWGTVKPFALSPEDLTIYSRDGNDFWVYHDPGAPPHIGGVGDDEYRTGFEQVVLWSGLLDPADGVMIDISPASNGNNTLGSNDGSGYDMNPATGMPYTPEIVPAGDYYRVLAEFWADGPESETPPGHWFTIANYVSDHPATVKQLKGKGPLLDDLQWDLKLYLAMGGAMHDTAVTAWGIKGWYDYIRPVSAIRYLCDNGQSSDPGGSSYHPDGIGLYPGSIEVITEQSAGPGGAHSGLGGNMGQHIGKIAVHAWRGPDYIGNPATSTAGVGWIRCEDWWPYQRPTFVTPPFAGYVSGHSAFSRAAAIIMTRFTGDEFFPGGLGVFEAPKDEFLVFEDGPSVDITLQWAKYFDAADETSLSRIYGGIHPPADDIPGRIMGADIGDDAFELAFGIFGPPPQPVRATFTVSKNFTDGDNPSTMDVTINCFSGLPISQTQTVSESQDVEFTVGSFAESELNCSITEELADDSYTPAYLASGHADSNNAGGCNFFNGENYDENFCEITNSANPVELEIEKLWVVEGVGGDAFDTHYQLILYCAAEIMQGSQYCGSMMQGSSGRPLTAYQSCKVFNGSDSATFTASVIPNWPTSHCWVEESVSADGVVIENNCGDLQISAGQGDRCLITNTLFFEGVPSLNRTGLLILILLMSGVGLIAFRRLS